MQDKNPKAPPDEQQLLRDIQELTRRQYVYEDLWCGMVPFDGMLTELQTGPPVPFADLTWREQADVLRTFIHWGRYPERAWNDEYRIRENIEAGMPAEDWLQGTSLAQSFQHLADGKTPPPVQREPQLTWDDLSKLHFRPDHPETANAAGPEQTPGRQDATPATVHFKGFLCEMHWTKYTNGRPALYLIEANTGETVAVATANLPDAALKPDEVFIKDHSENQGMLATLEQAGIVKATGESVPSGFVDVPVAKVLQPAITVPIAEQLFGQPTIGVTHDSSAGTEAPQPEPKPKPKHAHRPRHKL